MTLDDTILGLTEQECRAALLNLAGDEASNVLTEKAVSRVLALTRPQEGGVTIQVSEPQAPAANRRHRDHHRTSS